MSRREIIAVCELTAHLAQRDQSPDGYDCIHNAPHLCASDALALQRLGRRTRRMFAKAEKDHYGTKLESMVQEKGRIEQVADEILKPYGLSSKVSGMTTALYIVGLPGNSADGDKGGFAI